MSKVFDNSFTLPKRIIQKRFSTLDDEAEIFTYSVTIRDEDYQPIGVHYYATIESTATEAQIRALLGSAITADEQTYITQLGLDKQTVRNAYGDMITRLEQIQNAGAIPFTAAGFNQVVQAVKDEALYIERIMKVIKAIVM